jgi:type II restriction/modification system DNA methylase subunit YeeA
LVAYWFERVRTQIEHGQTKRAGLLATQSIRGEASRPVLARIFDSGGIFMAWSDRPWVLEGAAVRVSLIGFDDGTQSSKVLDGKPVTLINADLTTGVDVTQAMTLAENKGLAFMGIIRVGRFELDEVQAHKMLAATNSDPTKRNETVIKPWIRATDITDRPQDAWIIDFGVEMPLEEAEKYEMPLSHIRQHVKPFRDNAKSRKNREEWWLFEGKRSGMRIALSSLMRYVATPLVGKHHIFVWQSTRVLPDARVIVFAREDDYCFGLLQSNIHETWVLERAGRHGVGNDPTYNITTCFETFPFPWPPGQEPAEAEDERVAEIAHWARALHTWREAWLNPPPPPGNIVEVAYAKMVQSRALTNLYNGLVYYRETVQGGGLFLQAEFDKVTRHSVSRAAIQELDDIHRALDTAVLDAYGWPPDLTDEAILERLLVLNLERAGR